MDTINMNSKNSKTSDPHRLLLSLSDKIDLNKNNKYVALSNLSMYYTWKNIRSNNKNIKTTNLKYQFKHGMKNLNCLIGHILYQICKIILSIF